VGGKYLVSTHQAKDDVQALLEFSRKVNCGKVKVNDQNFYDKSRTIITYEEIDSNESNKNRPLEEAAKPRE
jgi:hypothetical protein